MTKKTTTTKKKKNPIKKKEVAESKVVAVVPAAKEESKPVVPAAKEESKPVAVTKEMCLEYLFGARTKLTSEQQIMFINTAILYNLNPYKKEIFPIAYKNKYTGEYDLNIVIGYEVYLKRAERSGKLAGWKIWTEGVGQQLKACIEVHRKDWTIPLYHEVFYREYDLKKSLWITKPTTMIKKVAIAQGFRLAFPDELGGIPYTADELPTEMTTPSLPEPENGCDYECTPDDAEELDEPELDEPERDVLEKQIQGQARKYTQKPEPETYKPDDYPDYEEPSSDEEEPSPQEENTTPGNTTNLDKLKKRMTEKFGSDPAVLSKKLEALTRWKGMAGKTSFEQIPTETAAIAIHTKLERQLIAQKIIKLYGLEKVDKAYLQGQIEDNFLYIVHQKGWDNMSKLSDLKTLKQCYSIHSWLNKRLDSKGFEEETGDKHMTSKEFFDGGYHNV
jgi:phage recombination protein Bet